MIEPGDQSPPLGPPPLEVILDFWLWRLDLARRFQAWRTRAALIRYDGGWTPVSAAHGERLLALNSEWRELERCGDDLRALGATLESNPFVAPTTSVFQ